MQQMNLTEGVIWKTLLRYSFPVVLSSLLQSTYSIVDLALAGYFVGDVGISAINNAGQVMLLLTQIIMGVTMGGNVLIGQYYGAKQREGRIQTNRTLFAISLLCGLIAALALVFSGGAILRLLGAPAWGEATAYLKICALGLLPVFGYNALSAMLRGVGNAKVPLYCIFAAGLLNLGLDVLFMGPMSLGVRGAAVATLLSQLLSFVFALAFVLRARPLYEISLRRFAIHGDKLRSILRLGIPSAVQMALVGISWLSMTFLINGYGLEASAASGIALKIRDLAQLFVIAMSSAASIMIAQCLGAQDYVRAQRTLRIALRIALGVSALLIVLVELFAPQFVACFQPDAQTALLAVKNLRIEIFSQLFYAMFLLHNALAIAAGHTRFVLLSSIVNSIVVRLVLALVFNHYFGLVGIFWACMLAPASSVPLGYLYEHSGRWRRSLVQKEREHEDKKSSV